MRRGEIWTLSGGPDYTGKPRPAVVIQDNHYDGTESITVVVATTADTGAPTIRPRVDPTETNGLARRSYLMVDKVTTVPKRKIGRRIGVLSPEDVTALNRGIVVFLGLASTGGP